MKQRSSKIHDKSIRFQNRADKKAHAPFPKRNFKIYSLLASCLLGFLVFLTLHTTAFQKFDASMGDRLYQTGNLSSGKIVIIGIDSPTIEALGNPSGWSRQVYADLLEQISPDPENGPAVIGLDILFSGSGNQDPDGDTAFARMADSLENVVTVNHIEQESQLISNSDGTYSWETVSFLYQPYDALRSVTIQGIDNTAEDKLDYVVRNCLLSVSVDGETYPSFALATAKCYAEKTNFQLQLPVSNSNSWYLDYTNATGNYSCQSFLDVYEGNVNPDLFAGKIVLIGAYADGLQDLHVTPLQSAAGSYMYGVDIQANAIDSLLKADYKTKVSDTLQTMALVFACLICIWLVCVPGFWSMALLWIASFGLIPLYRFLYESPSFSLVFHPTWILAVTSAYFLLDVLIFGMQKFLERRMLYQQFGRYVDKKVLAEISRSDQDMLPLNGTKVPAAILFVDICGFTTLSEKLKDRPDLVVRLLNQYLDYMSSCILKNGGTIDKFIGDAVMAFWGAPIRQDLKQSTEDAVQTAIDMAAGMEALRKTLRQEFSTELSDDPEGPLSEICNTLGFAIGIDVGEVVIGNIGSSQRLDYTAIGDVVNTASRLEGLKISGRERKGKIYISRETRECLTEKIQVFPLPPQPLKGKEGLQQIYEIVN